jgi:hypothetical protein
MRRSCRSSSMRRSREQRRGLVKPLNRVVLRFFWCRSSGPTRSAALATAGIGRRTSTCSAARDSPARSRSA